MGHFHHYP